MKAFVLLFILIFAFKAHAACTSGVAGQQRYNDTYNYMEFCNDTEWRAMYNWAVTTCTAGEIRTQRYNSSEMQFCNGTDWISMKGYQKAACSVANKQRYDATDNEMQFCDGSNWYNQRYSINAVEFDGTNDYLTRGGDLTGVADSSSLTLSFWVRSKSIGVIQRVYTSAGNRLRIRIEAAGNIEIFGKNLSNVAVLDISSSGFASDTWYHVLASIDLSDTAKRHIYINDVSDLATVNTYTNDTIDFTRTNHAIGSHTNGNDKLDGQLADLYFDYGTYTDLSIVANRRKFISADGKPVFLGTDGSIPTSVAPEIFLSGATASWHTNKGTGGGFTENGAIADSPSHPEDLPPPTPNPFAFTDQTGVSLSTLISSNILQMTGMSHAGDVTISGGGSPEYRICDDATCTSVDHTWSSSAGSIDNNQYLQLRLTSGASNGILNSAIVNVGTGSDQWDVSTPDDVPNAFAFTDQPSVTPSTLINSNIVQITGIDDGITAVSISGGGSPQYRICNNATCSSVDHTWATSGNTIDNGQYLQLRLTSNATSGVKHTGTVVVGSSNDAWEVTTSLDDTPNPFAFTDLTSQAHETLVTSNIVQITGIDDGISTSISGDGSSEYRICNNSSCSVVDHTWSSAAGLIDNNQYLQVRMNTSAIGSTVHTATPVVGTGNDNWTTTTVPAKKVFITSTTYNGNLGGVSGADSKCAARATAAGLTGTYKAWISSLDPSNEAADNLTQSTIEYELITGTRIANNWTDLTDGSVDNPIDRDEFGNTQSGVDWVWTNTTTSGNRVGTTSSCNNTGAGGVLDDWDGTSSSGRFGSYRETGSTWTSDGSTSCSTPIRLYCFEQ